MLDVSKTAEHNGAIATLRSYLKPSVSALLRDDRVFAFAVSLLATLVFYMQALASGSLDAGVIYTGDYWHQCLPALIKTYSLFSKGVFTGIDFSTHNGASDFFLRPNLEPYHPLLVVSFLLHHFHRLGAFMAFSIWMLALHSFVACYYAMRLAARILAADKYLSAFVGLGFAFSVHMAVASFYPQFVLVVTMLPAAIYGGLKVGSAPSLISAILYSLPVFVMLTGGYVALAVASILFAVVFTAAGLFYVDPMRPFSVGRRQFTLALTPYLIAGSVAAPYYWVMFRYHSLVPSAVQSLHVVAHLTAEMPRTALRMLSGYLTLPGPLFELTPTWGIISVSVTLLFLFGLRGAGDLPEREWRLLKVCGVSYCFILLTIYGRYSALSDFLYFIPLIGKMHIYQRYLLVVDLFWVIAVAIMLRATIGRGPGALGKFLVAALAGMLAVSCLVMLSAGWVQLAVDGLHLSDHFIFELLLGLVFAASLLLPGRSFAVGVATCFMFLIPLNRMFDYTRDHPFAAERNRHLEIEPEVNDRLVEYFRSESKKSIIKYLDITPDVREYLSKNYPWFVLDQVTLGSYGGYDWHVGTRDAYMQRMQVTKPDGQDELIMRPDWHWVARTGGEFVVYREGHPLNDPGLEEFADTRNPSRVLHLPNGIVVAPLRFGGEADEGGRTIFDNGYLRAFVAAPVESNLAMGGRAEQSSVWSAAVTADKAVDGNVVGGAANGSMSRTKDEANAWWQVDLGADAAISAIEMWNGSDCCADEMRGVWIYVSAKPFARQDTPSVLRSRRGVWSCHLAKVPAPARKIYAGGARGRYVRVQLDGDGYLGLAEVQVFGTREASAGAEAAHPARETGSREVADGFHTNGASELALDLHGDRAVKVQYLFWPNERLKFYVQGSPVVPTIEDGLQTVSVPSGHQHLEIRYVNWPLRIFLLLYAIYALTYVSALAAAILGKLWLRAPHKAHA